MSDYPETLDHMMAAWNETNPAKVRSHLEQALSPDVRFVDPSIDVLGIDGFEANVHEVHERVPGATYARTSPIDSQHGFHRYHWAIHQQGKLLLSGFDVAQTDDNGRVVCVIGFFGGIDKH